MESVKSSKIRRISKSNAAGTVPENVNKLRVLSTEIINTTENKMEMLANERSATDHNSTCSSGCFVHLEDNAQVNTGTELQN